MALKYKAGDRVRIKSLDWYNENKDEDGIVELSTHLFIPEMVERCGTVVTIKDVFEDIDDNVVYYMKEIDWDWTNEMIECKVEEETKPEPKFKVGDKIISDVFSTKNDKGWKVIDIERTGYRLISVNNPDLICDMDFKNEHYYKLVEEETTNIIEEAKTYWDSIKDAWICPEGYIFKDENGNVINATKIVLEKKKEYPITIEECCKILGLEFNLFYTGVRRQVNYKDGLLHNLKCLLIYRDAYWKIAGEEMGLGKPWKPDWDAKDNHFYTIHTFNGKIECSATAHRNAVLIFPTEEMRDAFYENFKEEIESCKELL